MGNLREIASEPQKRAAMVRDAVRALDDEVGSKGGLSGMAIKTAYMMAKGVAPDMIPRIIDKLLDEFLDALQPFYDDAKAKGGDVAQHMATNKAAIADALLKITDARANRHEGGALKKGYAKLRPSAIKHVETGVPRLTKMVAQHGG